MCCTLLLLTESNTPIVNLDSRFHCNLILFFRCYTTQICRVWSCLVGISTDTADGNESLLVLLKLSGSEVQFVSQDSPGYSEAAKYCFLHRAGIALLGCLESPSTCGVGSLQPWPTSTKCKLFAWLILTRMMQADLTQ